MIRKHHGLTFSNTTCLVVGEMLGCDKKVQVRFSKLDFGLLINLNHRVVFVFLVRRMKVNVVREDYLVECVRLQAKLPCKSFIDDAVGTLHDRVG